MTEDRAGSGERCYEHKQEILLIKKDYTHLERDHSVLKDNIANIVAGQTVIADELKRLTEPDGLFWALAEKTNSTESSTKSAHKRIDKLDQAIEKMVAAISKVRNQTIILVLMTIAIFGTLFSVLAG